MNVLVALDASRYSEMVLQMAWALPLPQDASLTVATVIPDPALVSGVLLSRLLGRQEEADRLHREQDETVRTFLEKGADRLRARGFAVETRTARGKVAVELLRVAQQVSADLIILGAKGENESSRETLGTVAHKVLKHAACGVLLVRQELARVGLTLVGIDGSENSFAVARFLAGLTLLDGAQVHLVTALHSHSAAFLKMPTMDLDRNRELLDRIQSEEEQRAREVQREALALFRHSRSDVRSHVCRGDPSTCLMDLAEHSRADLIAIGAMGLTGVEQFLLGSVAQRIARKATCSVLVARHRQNQ